MKSRITTNRFRIFGGFPGLQKVKDWRITFFIVLAFVAGTFNFLKIIIVTHRYYELYNPIIWLLLGLFIYYKGVRSFYYLMLGIYIVMTLTNTHNLYGGSSIFLLMSFVLSRNRKERMIALTIFTSTPFLALIINNKNVINIVSVGIDILFGLFCYYGFIYTSSKAFGCKSKMQYNDKEYRVMYALATQDKTQKEICYELGISGADMARTLASAREKNGYTTNDMLLRQFAIELYKSTL